mgnify:CR=1 FL=1
MLSHVLRCDQCSKIKPKCIGCNKRHESKCPKCSSGEYTRFDDDHYICNMCKCDKCDIFFDSFFSVFVFNFDFDFDLKYKDDFISYPNNKLTDINPFL